MDRKPFTEKERNSIGWLSQYLTKPHQAIRWVQYASLKKTGATKPVKSVSTINKALKWFEEKGYGDAARKNQDYSESTKTPIIEHENGKVTPFPEREKLKQLKELSQQSPLSTQTKEEREDINNAKTMQLILDHFNKFAGFPHLNPDLEEFIRYLGVPTKQTRKEYSDEDRGFLSHLVGSWLEDKTISYIHSPDIRAGHTISNGLLKYKDLEKDQVWGPAYLKASDEMDKAAKKGGEKLWLRLSDFRPHMDIDLSALVESPTLLGQKPRFSIILVSEQKYLEPDNESPNRVEYAMEKTSPLHGLLKNHPILLAKTGQKKVREATHMLPLIIFSRQPTEEEVRKIREARKNKFKTNWISIEELPKLIKEIYRRYFKKVNLTPGQRKGFTFPAENDKNRRISLWPLTTAATSKGKRTTQSLKSKRRQQKRKLEKEQKTRGRRTKLEEF